jgi:hypothetical protein
MLEVEGRARRSTYQNFDLVELIDLCVSIV